MKEAIAVHTLLAPAFERSLLLSLGGVSLSASLENPHIFRPHREGSLSLSGYTISSKHSKIEQGAQLGTPADVLDSAALRQNRS